MYKLNNLYSSIFILISIICITICNPNGATENDLQNDLWKENTKNTDGIKNDLNYDVEEAVDPMDLWSKIKQNNWFKKSLDNVFSSNDLITQDSIDKHVQNLLKTNDLQKLRIFLHQLIRYLCKELDDHGLLNPRQARTSSDDCIELQRSRPPYAPRLGKKSFFRPRLGRQACNGINDQKRLTERNKFTFYNQQ